MPLSLTKSYILIVMLVGGSGEDTFRQFGPFDSLSKCHKAGLVLTKADKKYIRVNHFYCFQTKGD